MKVGNRAWGEHCALETSSTHYQLKVSPSSLICKIDRVCYCNLMQLQHMHIVMFKNASRKLFQVSMTEAAQTIR